MKSLWGGRIVKPLTWPSVFAAVVAGAIWFVVQVPVPIVERLMEADIRPTAVMCGNDVLAAGAIGQARAMGLDVPGDVSVTGFDDIEIAKVVFPPITTVHVPHKRMGKEAARQLVALVKKQKARPSVRLETELRLRGSLK